MKLLERGFELLFRLDDSVLENQGSPAISYDLVESDLEVKTIIPSPTKNVKILKNENS
jgi:hypothetical protein